MRKIRWVFVLTFGVLTLLLFHISTAQAVTVTWDGGGADNNWSTANNWSGNSVPTSEDDVVFDGTSTKDATIDASFGGSVNTLSLNSGYTGTVTLSRSLTLAGNYSQAAGTFNGSNQSVDFNGRFTLSGGTFTAPSGDMNIASWWLHTDGGTFSHNNGTVIFDSGGASVFDANTTDTFYNLTENKGGGAQIEITTGDTMQVDGTLTLTDGTLTSLGRINAKNVVTVASTYDGGGHLLIDGATTRTVTLNAGASMPNTTINHANITVETSGTGTVTWLQDGFTLQAGTFNAGSVNMSWSGSITVSGGTFNANSGTHTSSGALTISSGTFNANTSTTTFSSTLTLSGGNFNCNTATLTFTDEVSISNASSTFDCSSKDSVTFGKKLSLTNGTFTPKASSTLTINGNGGGLTTTGGTFNNASSQTLVFAGSGGPNVDLNTSLTVSNMTINMASADSFVTITTNDTLTVSGTLTLQNGMLGGGGTVNATNAVTVDSGFDGAWANQGYLLIDGSTTRTITLPAGAKLPNMTINNANITVNTSGSGTVSWADGPIYLTVQAGTFSAGSVDLSFSGLLTISGGTFTASSGTTTLKGGLTFSSGTFSHNNGTVTLSSSGQTINPNSSMTFYNLTQNMDDAAGMTIDTGDTLIVANTLTLTNGGTYTGTLQAQGNVVVGSGFDGGDAPLAFASTANQSFDLTGATGVFNGDITINKSSGTVTLASALVMDAANQDLTITAGTLDLNGQNLTVNGSSGTFTVGASGILQLQGGETITGTPAFAVGGTAKFVGTSSYTIPNVDYYHLTLNGSGGVYSLGSGGIINGDLTIASGATFNLNGQGLAMGGSISNNGTFQLQGGETLSASLVALYHFDESSWNGTSGEAVDSFLANNGTGQGGVSTSASGKYSRAGSFDGTDDYVNSPTISIPSEITVSAWVYTSNANQNGFIVEKKPVNTQWELFYEGGNVRWRGASTNNTISATAPSANQWHHLVATQSGTSASLYIDGVLAVSGTETAIGNAANTIQVGAYLDSNNNGGYFFNGLIDDVAIYDRALSASAVSALYSSSTAISPTAFSMDTDSGTVTYNGTSTYSSLIAGNSYNNLTFNGSGGSWTHTSALDVNGNMTITAGTLNSGGQNMTVGGNWSNSGTYTSGSNAVTFDGSGAQTLTSGGTGDTQDFNNLTVNKSAETLTLATNAIDVDGTLTVTSGTLAQGSLAMTAGALTVNGGTLTGGSAAVTVNGTLTVSSGTLTSTSGNLHVSSNFDHSGGTFTHNSGTVILNGNDQTISGTSTFNNLTKSNTSAVTLTFPASTTTTVAGTLTLTGASGQRLHLRSSSTGTQWSLDAQGTRSVEYLDVKDSNSTNTTIINCWTDCNNSENNTKWSFAQPTLSIDDVTVTETEGNVTATFTVTQSAASGASTTVNYVTANGTATSGSDYTAVASTQLTIAAGSTSNTLTVTVSGDMLDEDNETYTVDLSGASNASISDSSGTGTITDNDATPSVTFTASTQSAAESTSTMTVTAELSAASGRNVSVPYTLTGTATGSGTDYTITSSPVSISAGSTTTTMTITVVNDSIDESDETVIVTMGSPTNASHGATTVHTATITDNDTSGVTLAETGGSINNTEGDATTADTYTAVLNSQPTADVTITIAPDTQASVSTTTLTFTTSNWNTAQAVTVTAVNDDVAEGSHTGTITHTAASSDTNYSALSIASVTDNITDNDTASVSIAETSGSTAVSEAGATDTYTVVLGSQPTASVTITLTASAQVSGSPTTLTFTASDWNTAQTVTVSAVADSISEGTVSGTIQHAATSSDTNYSGISVRTLTIQITDNDTAGVTVTEADGSTAVTEGGATDTYTVVLTSQPTEEVAIAITTGSRVSVDSSTLTFTATNWNTAQTVTVTAVNNSTVDGSATVSLTHAATSSDTNYNGITIASVTVSVTDDDKDDQKPTANAGLDQTMIAGTSITLDGSASTGSSLTYLWTISSGGGSLASVTTATPTFTIEVSADTQDAVVKLTVQDSHKNEATDTVTIGVIGSEKVEVVAVETPLVGLLDDGTVVYEKEGEDETILVMSGAQIYLPDGQSDYVMAVTADGTMIIGVPNKGGARGTVYFSKQTVSQFKLESATIDLDDLDKSSSLVVEGGKIVDSAENSFKSASGNEHGDQFGDCLITSDIDGDGKDEVLVGAPYAGAYGGVYIYSSASGAYELTAAIFGTREKPVSCVLSGAYLSSAQSLLFGPYNRASSASLRYEGDLSSSALVSDVALLKGKKFTGDFELTDLTSDARVVPGGNQSVQASVFGDVNGDGKTDLILANAQGDVKIFFGPRDPSSTAISTPDVEITGSRGESFGQGLAVGDLNKDGIGDLIIGAPAGGAQSEGKIYVAFGSTRWASTMDTSNARILAVTGSTKSGRIGSDFLVVDQDKSGAVELYTITSAGAVLKVDIASTKVATVSTTPDPDNPYNLRGSDVGGWGCACQMDQDSTTTNPSHSSWMALFLIGLLFTLPMVILRRLRVFNDSKRMLHS